MQPGSSVAIRRAPPKSRPALELKVSLTLTSPKAFKTSLARNALMKSALVETSVLQTLILARLFCWFRPRFELDVAHNLNGLSDLDE